ncbi:MAG: zf-HC2 domain-containing protein [Myxococcota bacterium]
MSKEAAMMAENEHDQVESILAWYANGELDGDEAQGVSRHLEGCETCRVSLADLELMKRAIIEEPVPWTPDPGAFDRLQTQIAIEAPRVDETAQDFASSQSDAAQGWLDWLQQKTALPRWTLGIQAAALVLLAAFAFGPGGTVSPPEAPARYETLTDETGLPSSASSAAVAAKEGEVLVGFAQTATEPEIRSLLISEDATIVGGPSRIGLYRVSIATGKSLEAALASLRASEVVTLAEPLQPVPAPGNAKHEKDEADAVNADSAGA